jgi:hypothetical protein
LKPEFVSEYDDPSLKMTKRYAGYVRFYDVFLLALETVYLDLNSGLPHSKTLYIYPVAWGDWTEVHACGTIRFNSEYGKYMFEPTSRHVGCIYVDAHTATQLTKTSDMKDIFCDALQKGRTLKDKDYEHRWLKTIVARAGLCEETIKGDGHENN